MCGIAGLIHRGKSSGVGAEIQAITYNEFLPALLGYGAISAYAGYDPAVNAQIANEFSTAAFRVGHTMLSPELQRLDANGDEAPEGHIALLNAFFNPGEVIELPLARDEAGTWRSDWEPLLSVLSDDMRSQRWRAEAFHTSMAHALVEQALKIRGETEFGHIGLCGGVFQNRVLTEQVVSLLEDERFDVFLPSALPVNDAALSFGQAAEIAARIDGE